MSNDWDKFLQTEKPAPCWFSYGTLGIILMLIGAFTVLTISSAKFNILRLNTISQLGTRLIHLDTQTSRFILRNGIPILDRVADEDDPFTLMHLNWSEIYWRLAANVKTASPKEILSAQFPLLALFRPKPAPIIPPKIITIPQPTTSPEPPKDLPGPVLAGVPSVLIYHTHTSESYIPVSGKDHHLNAKGDIVQVGEYLQKVLEEKYKVECVHNEEIHDQYPFRDSYKRSQVTLIKCLKENPSYKAVIDLHRDATPGLEATCSIQGKVTATIMIVVGSDKMGLPHPNWKKNLQFANKLTEIMNLYYPGLSNGVIVSDARYNQHLNDHALIIEIGDQNSTLEQVNRAAELFAEVLVLTLNQETPDHKPTTFLFHKPLTIYGKPT
jgi:stage II sporulation protein P